MITVLNLNFFVHQKVFPTKHDGQLKEIQFIPVQEHFVKCPSKATFFLVILMPQYFTNALCSSKDNNFINIA